jgi:hemerythrin
MLSSGIFNPKTFKKISNRRLARIKGLGFEYLKEIRSHFPNEEELNEELFNKYKYGHRHKAAQRLEAEKI